MDLELEIETLLHLKHNGPLNDREDSIQQLLSHQSVEDITCIGVFGNSSSVGKDLDYVGNRHCETEAGDGENVVTVRGLDIPTEYEVVGLRADEIPVIGELNRV